MAPDFDAGDFFAAYGLFLLFMAAMFRCLAVFCRVKGADYLDVQLILRTNRDDMLTARGKTLKKLSNFFSHQFLVLIAFYVVWVVFMGFVGGCPD